MANPLPIASNALAADTKHLPVRRRDVIPLLAESEELSSAITALATGNALETFNRLQRAWESACRDALIAHFGSIDNFNTYWESKHGR